ncbi:phenylalanine 4-monooxygenase [Candidatus Kaiserbacteria bacterium]|nr:phenylalanine 4-monooxygenase [Candidatus Kaiserbacteria bacterium]
MQGNTARQDWAKYTDAEHDRWRRMFECQQEILEDRACTQFLNGLEELGVMARQIPDFKKLNAVLFAKTGWKVVAVPGLVDDAIFFEHLAKREFPATCFIRREDQLEYIQEPDIFHDVYGHVPMLVDPIFADYMQAYGKGGLRALDSGMLPHLARLYWYTVEFGLIQTSQGLRIYGSGIVSSKKESIYALGSTRPRRMRFDLVRVMKTRYRIDNLQKIYFIIRSIEELMEITLRDFGPIYAELRETPEELKNLAPERIAPGDEQYIGQRWISW